jgi:putative phosphoesterase
MRVAALYDIHGNVHALDAVLAELERLRPDAILVGGDIVAGPFPVESLERLVRRKDVQFIRGNTEREVVHLGPDIPPSWVSRTQWVHDRLSPEQRRFLDQLPEQTVLDIDGVGPALFVHGSPRSDEEIVTFFTADSRLREILQGVQQEIVVVGHTHSQFDRTLDGIRFVNAGSVGMPYEERPGAYWALLGPTVELKRTEYDLDQAVTAIRASGFPNVDDFVNRALVNRPSPREAAAFFEKVAAERAPASK